MATKNVVTVPVADVNMKPLKMKYCAICGMGSHREDWQGLPAEAIVCDSHTEEQLAKAQASKNEVARKAAIAQAEDKRRATRQPQTVPVPGGAPVKTTGATAGTPTKLPAGQTPPSPPVSQPLPPPRTQAPATPADLGKNKPSGAPVAAPAAPVGSEVAANNPQPPAQPNPGPAVTAGSQSLTDPNRK